MSPNLRVLSMNGLKYYNTLFLSHNGGTSLQLITQVFIMVSQNSSTSCISITNIEYKLLCPEYPDRLKNKYSLKTNMKNSE